MKVIIIHYTGILFQKQNSEPNRNVTHVCRSVTCVLRVCSTFELAFSRLDIVTSQETSITTVLTSLLTSLLSVSLSRCQSLCASVAASFLPACIGTSLDSGCCGDGPADKATAARLRRTFRRCGMKAAASTSQEAIDRASGRLSLSVAWQPSIAIPPLQLDPTGAESIAADISVITRCDRRWPSGSALDTQPRWEDSANSAPHIAAIPSSCPLQNSRSTVCRQSPTTLQQTTSQTLRR